MVLTELKTFLVAAEDTGKANVFGVDVEFLIRSNQTGGVFSAYKCIAEPGMGAPPHVHSREEETFHVIEGEFEVFYGDEKSIVTAGGTVFLPRNVPHAFRNCGTTTGVLLGFSTPGGHEDFFIDAARLDTGELIDMDAARAVCAKHGMTLLV